MTQEVIRLDQVSLWRRTQEEFSYDLKRTIFSFLQGKHIKPAKKQVLQDVDFSVSAGEKVGIIGSNGAGKSTLLKVICGILPPTEGSVRVRGRIAPLIELGAGFNMEMSVQDNIILYGVLLGYRKEDMKVRIREILEFAELEDYAEIPVKALSSGMKARLGFSVATDVEPDILILDEVLSVGDARFTQKSRQRIQDLWEKSSTILFVSHSLDYVQDLCDRSIWLNKGQVAFAGDTEEAIKRYLDYVGIKEYIAPPVN
ncbi:ABC transporter ATP-binding protein [Cyanobacterium aponinum UTEX 3222]|uniref:ATP-binding cassette domain-containing protein n=2 Tax=Cyanobacterium aponinum TaxID=379064 RepID=A0A844GRE1_9CHRO|nr:ABC transporter ATP-binding protein [Cyanobacterium aponinum]WRL41645.1 ABC transporter ATP-binding protein [Cyanobacterium aponinum UTEX 3222]MBD2393353.1 ABC transporter ATP-binding protein [Cyanobacterium aponinum FACHB-4101]MTF38510.1 ATP-binding cassette domain-containing protein [Cyanobacterium aponinum 0216]PHV63448.1 ATP-binding protein [Cyanobacterium aponinum IPPAS B-1201]WPF89833.1 ABC transporter ATP-binding protein [Cyanobacterium aponinum AL20115]